MLSTKARIAVVGMLAQAALLIALPSYALPFVNTEEEVGSWNCVCNTFCEYWCCYGPGGQPPYTYCGCFNGLPGF
jgi:hypothetical protein